MVSSHQHPAVHQKVLLFFLDLQPDECVVMERTTPLASTGVNSEALEGGGCGAESLWAPAVSCSLFSSA